MNLAYVGACLLQAVKESSSIECTSIRDGCLWCGVISIASSEGIETLFKSPPVYVSSDIACGGVQFLVDTIRKSLAERKPVKSWEAPLQETKDARLSA
jgi:hypothetical protein